MRLKLILAALASTLLLMFGVLGQPAYAVDVLQPCANPNAKDSSVCKDANNTDLNKNPLFGPQGIITTFIHILALIIAVGSVVMIMFGGFKFITSGGDPPAVETAKKTVFYAIIGLVVAAAAQLVVSFVLGKLPA